MLANLTYVLRDFNELLHSRKKLCHTKKFYIESFVGCRFKVMELPRFLWLLPHSGAQNIFFHVHRDLYFCKGACDGVEGAVKRLARKASMQRVAANHIHEKNIPSA